MKTRYSFSKREQIAWHSPTGVLNKCLYGEAPPEVQPLTILWTQMVPLSHNLFRNCIPFNCCKCNVFLKGINHKNRTFSRLYKINLLALSGPNDRFRFPIPLFYTSTSEIPTLSYTWSLKKIIFSGGASPYSLSQGVPPGDIAPFKLVIRTHTLSK